MRLGISQTVSPSVHLDQEANDGHDAVPRVWADVVSIFASRQNMDLVLPQWKDLFDRQMIWFSWHPSLLFLAATVLRRRSAYLYWGHDSNHRLRNWRTKAIVRLASMNLVNEEVSRDFVARIRTSGVQFIPYCVDTTFFVPADPCPDQNTIVIPGNNGRDETAVIHLIRQGHSVIRVTSSREIEQLYREAGFAENVRYRLSYEALRQTYQQAAIVALPIRDLSHAAGQTAVLEALACGSRVLVTSPRMLSVVGGLPGVNDCTLDGFDATVSNLIQSAPQSLEDRKTQHAAVSHRHSIEAVVEQLTTAFNAL